MITATLPTSLPVVVLIDDDVFGVQMLDELIQGGSDLTKVCHTDPDEALGWIDRHAVDVVITDYDMPGTNGIELIKHLRRRPATADLPILMVTAIEDPSVRLAALDAGANDFIAKPFEAAEVRARVRNMLALRAGQKSLKQRAETLTAEVAAAVRSITAREQETILRLARAAEYRDSDTGTHLRRIAEYTGVIARGLMLPPAFQEAIYLAAPMHDVGKIGIPDYILRKPGLLEPLEYEIMQSHTIIGHQILEGSRSDLLQLAAEIALTHHERWDGSGYPNNLRSERIPLAGRIVAVADVFDALATKRPYKAAWETNSALDYVEKNSGVQFDPTCVDVLLQSREELLDIRERFAD
jgi:putative two-component system response regulator